MTKRTLNALQTLERFLAKHPHILTERNPLLVNCWEVMKCNRKSCPAYGRQGVRCWHLKATKCLIQHKERSSSQVKKCHQCVVYKSATSKPTQEILERFHNLFYSLHHPELYGTQPKTHVVRQHHIQTVIKNVALTAREVEILALLLERLPRKQIASRLQISAETVKKHTARIYAKYHVHTRAELFGVIKSSGT